MPPKGSSPRTLDLFEYTLTIPTPPSEPASAPAAPPKLAGWSDAQLAQHLGQLLEEMQRRMETGRGKRPTLEAAARQANLSLKRLVPGPTPQRRPSGSGKTSSLLQEGQRKAVRAALLAGVAPTQVAKHFGLSLAAVRKVLDEAS
jgi:hypothetical protein